MLDFLIGIVLIILITLVIYLKFKNAKKSCGNCLNKYCKNGKK